MIQYDSIEPKSLVFKKLLDVFQNHLREFILCNSWPVENTLLYLHSILRFAQEKKQQEFLHNKSMHSQHLY